MADYFDTFPETTTKPPKPTPKPFPRPGKPGTAQLPEPWEGAGMPSFGALDGKNVPQGSEEPAQEPGSWDPALTSELQPSGGDHQQLTL